MAADHKVMTITKTDPEVSEMLTELGRARARIDELEAALRELYDAVNLHENPTPAMATIERIMGWTKEDAQMAYEAHLARQKGAE